MKIASTRRGGGGIIDNPVIHFIDSQSSASSAPSVHLPPIKKTRGRPLVRRKEELWGLQALLPPQPTILSANQTLVDDGGQSNTTSLARPKTTSTHGHPTAPPSPTSSFNMGDQHPPVPRILFALQSSSQQSSLHFLSPLFLNKWKTLCRLRRRSQTPEKTSSVPYATRALAVEDWYFQVAGSCFVFL